MAGTLKDSFKTLKTAIGAGAGLAIGGAMGAVSGLGAGGTIGTLATGAVGGAVSGLLSGRKGKIFEGGQKQVQRSKATREANLAGSTALGRMRARVGSALGVSAYDNDQRIVNAYEDLSKQHKAYDSHMKEKFLKKIILECNKTVKSWIILKELVEIIVGDAIHVKKLLIRIKLMLINWI